MEPSSRMRRVRFGTFDVDLRSGELRKHGIRLKLQDQPFQVLALLLEHPGDLVTREELRQKLWPVDTFVDFDTGLNTAIKKLRDVLGDSAEEPLYIETLPRRGYRFIAHVASGNGDVAQAVAEPNPVQPAPAQATQKFWGRRLILLAAGAAALFVAAAIASWRVYFTRPVLGETDTILLASFANKTADPVFDNSLDKALEVKLAESPFLSLFPEPEARATLRMMRRDPNERVTPELGLEICNRQAIKAMVVPEITVFGRKYLITLEAIDARSKRSIARLQAEAESKDQVISALGKVGSQLRRQLGESLASLEKYDAPLDFATTSSLEALQSYRTGLMQFRAGKLREAAALLERAIELDPKFCSAYRVLGSVSVSLGDMQAGKKNYSIAFELNDGRMSQEERFLTAANYHLTVTGNLKKAIAELILYKDAYPRSTIARNVLGWAYFLMGRTEEARQEFHWANNHYRVPAAADSSNESQSLIVLGRVEEAKQILDQWWQRGSLSPTQAEQRYRIAFFENDTATMERLGREASADDLFWLALQQQLAFLRGDTAKLRSLSQTVVNQQKRAQQMENTAAELAWHARMESYLGNHALARDLCRQAGEASNESHIALRHCANALAEAGDVTRAQALAEKLDRLRPEDTMEQGLHLPLIRSVIESRRGNAAKAVDLLVSVAQYEDGETQVLYHRAKAYMGAAEYTKAAAEFEKLIGHRGWADWGVFAPLSQLGLAQAYAHQGDHKRSRAAYDQFFATWKDADPNTPRLLEAKAEYGKLTAVEIATARNR